MKPLLIAEVKTKSPFGFKSFYTFDELFDLADGYGDIISMHTDPRWNGSHSLVSIAKKYSNKKVLAKGIHDTDEEIQKLIDLGADHVLVVGRIPKKKFPIEKIWIEPLNLDQLKTIPWNMTVVWNSRNLLTGGLKTETWEQARNIFKGKLIQASNIKTKADVKIDAYGVIVGENLISYVKSIKPDVWETSDGRFLLISDMSDDHLRNTIKMICREFANRTKNQIYFIKDYNWTKDTKIEDVCPTFLNLILESSIRWIKIENKKL